MKTSEIIAYYGGTQQKAADALDVDQSTISDWLKAGYPPDPRQLAVEKLTSGALKAEPGCLERILKLQEA